MNCFETRCDLRNVPPYKLLGNHGTIVMMVMMTGSMLLAPRRFIREVNLRKRFRVRMIIIHENDGVILKCFGRECFVERYNTRRLDTFPFLDISDGIFVREFVV
jgi:hypothetical protein